MESYIGHNSESIRDRNGISTKLFTHDTGVYACRRHENFLNVEMYQPCNLQDCTIPRTTLELSYPLQHHIQNYECHIFPPENAKTTSMNRVSTVVQERESTMSLISVHLCYWKGLIDNTSRKIWIRTRNRIFGSFTMKRRWWHTYNTAEADINWICWNDELNFPWGYFFSIYLLFRFRCVFSAISPIVKLVSYFLTFIL